MREPVQNVFDNRTNDMGVNISVEVGDRALLPCRTDPHQMDSANVYWQKLPDDDVVLYYWKGKEHPQNQHHRYSNRTQMDNTQFLKGNLSLTLLKVTLNDTGDYQCIIKKKQRGTPEKYLIRLIVNETKTGNRHHFVLIGCGIAILIIGISFLKYWYIASK
ncbi:T-lymphocyte activation antigen CD80-like, partial [Scyliorhinus canicula]|uniref:T-lymphocyte activation antigen CD80-like n=1 Tax=Scyliorhinus canicula TaxID=7830 RepID=UPI0018F3534B